jgi:hypothetical protein
MAPERENTDHPKSILRTEALGVDALSRLGDHPFGIPGGDALARTTA